MRFLLLCCLLSSLAFGQTTHTIKEITVTGNTRTKTALLKKLINLELGTVVDSTKLANTAARLIRLPGIAHAYFTVEEKSNGAKIVYTVEEQHTFIPFANVYSSDNEDLAFRLGLQEFNFAGQMMTVGGFYQYDVFHSYGLQFRAPYLFSPQWGLEVNYQDLTTQEPVFLANGTADYKYNNRSIEVFGLYAPSYKHNFALGLSSFQEDYAYLFGSTDPNVPQELKVDKWLVKLLYTYDNINYFYYYLDGFKSSLNLQYVQSNDGNLLPFWLGFNDFTFFKRIGKRGNFATRLRLGLAKNIASPFAPFAVDNNLNIRGVGNTIDRGTGSVVLNTEYRFTLLDRNWLVLQGNAFIDSGSWRNPGGTFDDFIQSENLRVYPGIGIRVMHKKIFNAIFRIDYGHGITPDSSKGFVFGIGQYF
ncbi:outer membrane protein assembly factor [Croceivirga radicis]|uniref:Outer membrane protein assembly factor n=1 Tax=Croceivirga radicis TaxID=1929488 RepID=A0A1V6LQQ7_9FLAO|nr:POTRA domain-containing protein [Croceivirga radicis]OQD42525.1 outer membrane protein assembly factor [Croceivirga radicis]